MKHIRPDPSSGHLSPSNTFTTLAPLSSDESRLSTHCVPHSKPPSVAVKWTSQSRCTWNVSLLHLILTTWSA